MHYGLLLHDKMQCSENDESSMHRHTLTRIQFYIPNLRFIEACSLNFVPIFSSHAVIGRCKK